jgi:hypothetical protein
VQATTTTFYLDWTFWAAVLSLIAIVLSQLPPLRILLRPKRLEVEVHSRINITHMVGNPNASVVISIRNTGGRQLRVKAMCLNISRDGKPLMSLPAQNYYETLSSQSSILFVPFMISPGETKSHNVIFLNYFDRLTEKNFRESISKLDSNIRKKLHERSEGDKNQVIPEQELVQPFFELFTKLFVWQPGEYVAELVVNTEPGSASFSKKYRFTIYESDTAVLNAEVEGYQYGEGLAFNLNKNAGINIPLTEHIG